MTKTIPTRILNGLLCTILLNGALFCQASQAGEKVQYSVASKPLSTLLKRAQYKFEGDVPEFKGAPKSAIAKLNRDVLNALNSQIFIQGKSLGDQLTATTAYEIHYSKNNLLSFDISVSLFTKGTPHPTNTSSCFNYQLTGDAKNPIKKLALGDLLGLKAKYATASKMLAKTLSFPDYPTGTKQVKLNPSDKQFVFDDKGITWEYDDYEMGSYADAPKAGYLSFSKLLSVSSKDSIINQLTTHKN